MTRVLTEEQWRDVSARWSEMRPDDLDWAVHTEIHARGTVDVREEWERAMNLRVETVRPAMHMAVVRLDGTTLSGSSFAMEDEEEVPPRRTIAQWEVEHTLLIELLDVLVDVFGDEELMGLVRGRGINWEHHVEMWVWDRFTRRGRG